MASCCLKYPSHRGNVMSHSLQSVLVERLQRTLRLEIACSCVDLRGSGSCRHGICFDLGEKWSARRVSVLLTSLQKRQGEGPNRACLGPGWHRATRQE